MKRKELLSEVIKRIKQNDYSYQIKKYLGSKGITEEKQEEILAEAKKAIRDEKVRKLPVQNKIIFFTFLSLAIVTFVLFVFILPNYDIYSSSLFYAIIGAILFILFAMMTLVYKKRWTPELVEREIDGKLKPDYGILLFLAAVPCIISVFLLNWRYSSAEDAILKETQIRTIGTIVSGVSTSSRSYSSSTVIVEFTTLDGKQKTVKEEVGSYEFTKLYLGQKVNIIYSSKFPSIIELLTNQKEIRQFTNSAQRDISPKDLMDILDKKMIPSKEAFEKISLGWEYNASEKVWVNENERQFIKVESYGQVNYITDFETSYKFAKKLEGFGFKNSKLTEAKNAKGFEKFKRQNNPDILMAGIGTYEHENYILEITRETVKNKSYAVIVMISKLGS